MKIFPKLGNGLDKLKRNTFYPNFKSLNDQKSVVSLFPFYFVLAMSFGFIRIFVPHLVKILNYSSFEPKLNSDLVLKRDLNQSKQWNVQ